MDSFIYISRQNDYTSSSQKEIGDYRIITTVGQDCNIPRFIRFLYYIHFSNRINSYFKLPFKNIWARFILPKEVKNILKTDKSGKICFIFIGMSYHYIKMGSVEYLKRKYPDSSVFFFLSDRCELYKNIFKDFDISSLFYKFDGIYTYNMIDVKKYGFRYNIPRYREFSIKSNCDRYDILFVGRVKGRLEKIQNLYKRCQNLGLRTKFYIGVDNATRIELDDIGLEHGPYIPYKEVLELEMQSKCIINIVQDGAEGITLRDYEAIGMNRILITNSHYIEQTDFYTPEKVIFIEDLEKDLWKIEQFDPDKEWNGKEKYSEENYYKWLSEELDKLDGEKKK